MTTPLDLRDYLVDLGEDTSEDNPEKQTSRERIIGLFPKAAYARMSAWVAEAEKTMREGGRQCLLMSQSL